jgi:hypothetical protein
MKKSILTMFAVFLIGQLLSYAKDTTGVNKIRNLESEIQDYKKSLETLNQENDSLKRTLNYLQTTDWKSLELVSNVNSFYDNAWNKLVYLLSIIGGIIVFVIPLILSRLQRRELKLNKEDFQEYVDKKIIEFERTIKEHNDESIKSFGAQIELNQQKEIAKLYAMTFHLQGREHMILKHFNNAIDNFIKSLNQQLYADHTKNIPVSLQGIYSCLIELNKNKQSLTEKRKKDIENIIDNINKDYPDIYSDYISKITKHIA